MTFTAQPMRDGRVSVRPTPTPSIPGRPAVTSPSQIPCVTVRVTIRTAA